MQVKTDKIITFIREFISNLLKLNVHVERALLNNWVRLSEVAKTDANNTNHFLFDLSSLYFILRIYVRSQQIGQKFQNDNSDWN